MLILDLALITNTALEVKDKATRKRIIEDAMIETAIEMITKGNEISIKTITIEKTILNRKDDNMVMLTLLTTY